MKTIRKANGELRQVNEKFLDEVLEAGDVVIDTPEVTTLVITDEDIAIMQRNKLRKSAKKYLSETDWYVTRNAETDRKSVV